MQEDEKVINVHVSHGIYSKLFQRRVETGVPIYKISETIFKFGSFILDSLDKETSWQLTDDAVTLLHGKIFRDKLAKKNFSASDLDALDAIIARAQAFLTQQRREKE